MKFFKKNQIIIYVIALMLVTAGYLNYTTEDKDILANAEEIKTAEARNIGDAQLVNSDNLTNNIVENAITSSINTTNTNEIESNPTKENAINSNEMEEEKNKKNEVSKENTQSNSKNSDQENTIETNSKSTSSEYFTSSKLERDTMYSQMIETYEKVLNSTNSLETQKQSATDEITKINNTKNSIMICENLIGTKGFSNNVIFVNGDSVTAIIGATELKQEEVAQIQNIIAREMKANMENIHIAIK